VPRGASTRALSLIDEPTMMTLDTITGGEVI
jgi:hypothetical protein